MEGTPLYTLLKSLEKPQPLDSFRGGLVDINVILHKATGDTSLTITGLAPFHTVEDLHRLLWLQSGKLSDTYPKYSYLAFEDDTSLKPAMGKFLTLSEDGMVSIPLPDPRETIQSRRIQTEFVEENGTKKLFGTYTSHARMTLEDAFLKPYGTMPTFHCFPFRYLLSLYTGPRPISKLNWYGLLYPYFPSLDASSTGSMSPEDEKQSNQIADYIEAKLSQVDMLDELLDIVTLRELKTTGVRHLSFQWCSTERTHVFEGVDTLFFSTQANQRKPFIRLLMPNTTPLTKLYQPDPLEPPLVNDPVLLKTWVSEPSPDKSEGILYVKVLMRKGEYGLRPLFATLRVNEDTTADFTIQPPKEQRILDFRKDISNLPAILYEISQDMPFRLQDAKLGRASLNIELQFDSIPPKTIRKQVAERLSYLSTLLQPIEPPEGERPFLSYRYKAVSNFRTEDRIASYLKYVFVRRGVEPGQEKQIIPELVREFELTEDEALNRIELFIKNSNEIIITDPDTNECQVANNPGIDISLYNISAQTFVIQLFNIRAVSIDDILRVCTLFSLAFYGKEDDWNSVLMKEGITEENSRQMVQTVKEVELLDQLEDTNSGALGFNEYDDELAAALLEEAQKAVPPPPPPPPRTAKEEKKERLGIQVEDTQKIIAHKWYINRLEQLDRVLFGYQVAKGTGQLHYSSKCSAYDGRLPVILTEQQYQNMRRIYAKSEAEGRVAFIVYGVPNTKETIEAAKGKREQYTIMRYGSDPTNLFYFFCPRIFCLKDLLPILEDDWASETDFNQEAKSRNSCPFCHGKIIEDPHNAAVGQTVQIRKNKPGDTKPHSFIKFLAHSDHPEGYELPCCFVSGKHIDWEDTRFKAIRDASRMTGVGNATPSMMEQQAAEAAANAESLEQAYRDREQLIVSYEVLRWKLGKEYVLGSEKYPLEPGKVGLPSIELDSFFGQDSTTFIQRAAVKQEFKSNVHGFFRMGVLNKMTILKQSLFSALAPLMGLNTIDEVANRFTDLITPRVFLTLNFGNLLLEFFDPSDSRFPTPPVSVLSTWAQKHLLTNHLDDTRFEVSRLYRSYHRFISYIKDGTQRKQLRHFQHALAELKFITDAGGITLLVLHYKGNPRSESTDVEVLCPMLGYDVNRYANNQVGFLTFSDAGIWEPMIYIDRITDSSTSDRGTYFTVTPQMMQEPSFPKVVRDRYISEFLVKCRSGYRGAFTFQSRVDNRVLIPVGRVLDILKTGGALQPTGIVRDIYNHLIAITVRNPKEGRFDDILVPVVDDGSSFFHRMDLKIHVGIKSITLSSPADTYAFYKTHITPKLGPISNVYTLDSFLQTATKLVGYRLGGTDAIATIMLPCGNVKQGDEPLPADLLEKAEGRKMRGEDDFEFEYILNHSLMVSDNNETYEEADQNSFVIKRKQADILYEHLRLAFSNWIATTHSGEPRKFIEDLLNIQPWIRKPLLPSYEKMRRLEVEFGSTVRSWFTADTAPIDTQTILLKNDCISIKDDMARCSGVCKPVDGVCKIHTPTEVQIRSTPKPKSLDAVTYFTRRLFDELIRLPIKRHELMTTTVARLQVPSTNIHIGTQWILPENTPAWYDLLREKSTVGREIPEYYEEFSRKEPNPGELKELSNVYELFPLPDSLARELPQTAVNKLKVQVIGTKQEPASIAILRYFGIAQTGEEVSIDLTPTLLAEISKRYGLSVIQVQVTQVPIVPLGVSDGSKFTPKSAAYVLLPDFSEGPGIFVMEDDMSDMILGSYLTGKLYDSIQPVKPLIKRVLKRPVGKPA